MADRRAHMGFDHDNMTPADAGAAIPQTIWKTQDGILLAYGTTVPTAAAGYVPGAVFFKVDGTVYINTGNASSSTFLEHNKIAVEADITAGTVIASVGLQATATAVTAVEAAAGVAIPANTSHVTITSGNANHVVSLPAAVPGTKVTLTVGDNGCELVAAGTDVKINNVTCSATNEAALAADSHFIAECLTATTWILRGFTNEGADIAAIVPDTRA